MSSFYKNILVLASGSIIARLIGILSIPIITRLYSPADMGVLTAFISLTGVLLAFTSLRYSVVIPLPRTLGYALNSSVLCLIILSIVSALLLTIMLFFSPAIFQLFNLAALNDYWYLLPISVFVFGLAEILNIWAVRYKQFKLISAANVFQSSIGALSKIIFGLLGLNPVGLIIGQMLVQAGSVVTLFKFYSSNFNKKKISLKRILFISKYYIDIPRFRLPSQVLLSLSMNMPILFFSSYFGIEVAGQVGLALMVLSLPISLISQTIGQAFYGEIANVGRKNPHQIQKISKDIFKKILLISLLPFIVLSIFGVDLFRLFFGPEWGVAGEYSRIMSLYIVANLASSPLVNILNIYARNSFFLWINLSRFLLLTGVFLASIVFDFSVIKTLLFYSISLSAHYVLITSLIFKVLKEEVVKLDKGLCIQ
ncbi:MAG: O-antigen/teichoic acid export membrane protein [Mariniflexile sp.]|jgi:O-antigen/teichoic acid export membrane protein